MPHAKNNNKFDIKPAAWFSETVAGVLGEWYMLKFKPLPQVVKTYWGDRLWEQLHEGFVLSLQSCSLPTSLQGVFSGLCVALICSPHLGVHTATFTSAMNPHMSNFVVSITVDKSSWLSSSDTSGSFSAPLEPTGICNQANVLSCVADWKHPVLGSNRTTVISDEPHPTLVSLCQQPRTDHGAFAALATVVNNSRKNKLHVRVI